MSKSVGRPCLAGSSESPDQVVTGAVRIASDGGDQRVEQRLPGCAAEGREETSSDGDATILEKVQVVLGWAFRKDRLEEYLLQPCRAQAPPTITAEISVAVEIAHVRKNRAPGVGAHQCALVTGRLPQAWHDKRVEFLHLGCQSPETTQLATEVELTLEPHQIRLHRASDVTKLLEVQPLEDRKFIDPFKKAFKANR